MMGNYWLVNRARRWAAVCISKCACSTLKAHVAGDILGPQIAAAMSHHELHDWIGYRASDHLIPIADPTPRGFVRFAVWRPPLARFLSTYRQFGVEGMPRGNFAHLREAPVTAWVEFARRELTKPVPAQDEHLRRQCDYYSIDSVDHLVPIDALSRWLEQSFDHAPIVRNPTSTTSLDVAAIEGAILPLYARDIEYRRIAARRGILVPDVVP